MSRPSNVRTVSEQIEPSPIISPLSKAFSKLNSDGMKKGFGVFDRQTLKVFACYKDSVKFSLFALGGTFILSVNGFLRFNF